MPAKFTNIFGWLMGSALSLAILWLLPYNEADLAIRRLGQKIQSSAELRTLIAQNCDGLRPLTQNPFEQKLTSIVWTQSSEMGNEVSPNDNPSKTPCTLRIVETHSSQLGLISLWNFSMEIQGVHKSITRNYSLQFPKPLALFPIVFFLMHLIFDLGFGFLAISISLYLLTLNGMNLIQTVVTLGRILRHALLVDLNFYSYLLLSIWFSLFLSNPQSGNKRSITSSRAEMVMNRSLKGMIGLWNPHFYILIQRLIEGVGSIKRLGPVFESQLVVLTLSFLFLGTDLHSFSNLVSSVQVPRYISLAILIFFGFSQLPIGTRPEVSIFRTRNLPKYFVFIVTMEGLAYLYPQLRAVPTLFRISVALILAELTQKWSFSGPILWPNFKRSFIAIFLSTLLLNFTSERGLLDLIIELCDPRNHPTAVIPFAVISGFLLGFLSGGFSASSFIFISELVHHYPSGLIRAALFDGLVLGLILSPFSLFNLLPALLFQVPVENLLKERFNQVLVPFLIGFMIYLIGTLNLVGILQPVSFIFFCLCALTFKLKRVNWDFGMFGTNVRNDPR